MYKSLLLPFFASLLLSACSSSKKAVRPAQVIHDGNHFELTAISDDPTYGYKQENPVKVGGAREQSGPANERRFLNALTGPNGETISYHRKGSCCPFKTPNGFAGGGLLDIYEVTYEGLKKPIVIYINMYDAGELKAPQGFKFK